MQTIVEWTEQEPIEGGFKDRPRAFKYDEQWNAIVDFEHYEEVARFPIQIIAAKDPTHMKTHEARKLVKFCKDKLMITTMMGVQ